MTSYKYCNCGRLSTPDTLQCAECRKAAIKRFIKIAAIIGAVLGFICGQLPPNYQTPCRSIAAVLATCSP